ncbi:MAG TPA: carboxypeptidase regulatory-like domain-containing protein [Bryobacteraceae bacterium]|jgi:hypothetical protein
MTVLGLRVTRGLVASLAFAWLLFSQAPTANLTGLIKDPSGGVVPGVHLRVVNTRLGTEYSTVSNDDGYYSFQLLPSGVYNLSIEKAGFNKVDRSGIELAVQETVRMDFTLPLGATSQEVTVSGVATTLQTETSSISDLVNKQEVADLPILGRNAYALAQLVPGAFEPASFNNTPVDIISQTYISINGARENQNSFLLDGIANTSLSNGGPAVFPDVDAVQEYRVTTNNYSAEYGQAAGGVFNVATKSGSNSFHGDAYDYLRNDLLDANDFFSNRGGIAKAAFRFNQFGATLGGPIRKNKTFFFGAYEGVREIQGVTFVDSVPTALQRAGDFSKTLAANGQQIVIYDPFTTTANPSNPTQYTRTAFPGNVIPTSRFDPAAKALLQLLPLPNTAPSNSLTQTNNFVSSTPQVIDKDTFSTRVDHYIGEKQRLFGEFFYDRTPYTRPNVFDNVGTPTYGPTQYFNRRAAVISDTYTFSPTMIADFSIGFSRVSNLRGSPSLGVDLTQYGFPTQLAKQVQPDTIPAILIPGYEGSFSQTNIGPGTTIGENGYIAQGFTDYTLQGVVTKVAGKQTIKFGAGIQLQRSNYLQYADAGFQFSFSAAFTQGPNPLTASSTAGSGMASFLLGTPAGGQANFTPALALQSSYYDFFVQDDVKLTSRLTLNLGLRYDYESPWTDRYNQLTNFNYQAVPPLNVPGSNLHGALAFVGVNGDPRGPWTPDRTNFAPRLGLAYSIDSKTVMRMGGGLFFDPLVPATPTDTSGFSAVTSMTTSLNGVTPYNLMSNPFPQGLIYPNGSSQGPATLLGQSIIFADRDHVTPYSAAWNFNIQHEFRGGLKLETAYVGNRGIHNFADRSWDQLPDADLALGNQLLTTVPNPFLGQITSGTLSAPTVTLAQLLRPYPQFLGVTAQNSTWATSTYNALQVRVQKQVTGSLTIDASYTWSKLMDNSTGANSGQTLSGTGFQDNNNLALERSVSSLDIPQRFVIGYVWELPMGAGKKIFTGPVAKRIAGGWQVQGFATFASGEVLGVTTSVNTTQSQGGGQRPNWNGVNPAISNPSVNDWFNTSVFSQPATFTFGNVARTLATLRGSPARNLDFSILKNTILREGWNLQFRTEFFNLLNRPQFGPPGTAFGVSSFGVVSAQQNQPRIIQLALKFLF